MLHCQLQMEEILFNKDIQERENSIHEQNTILAQLFPVAKQTRSGIQHAVLQKALDMEYLHNTYPEQYKNPNTTILNAILTDAKKQGADKDIIQIIYSAFAYPEYDRFKLHVYHTQKRRQDIDIEKYGQAEMFAENMQVIDHIAYFENNMLNPTVQSYLQRQLKEMDRKQSKIRRDLEDEEKITIPRPEFIPKDPETGQPLTGRTSKLYESLLRLEETIHQTAIRVWQFPPKKDEDDHWYSEGVDIMTALLVPGTDLKYVRDTLSYFDISYEKNTQSIHSAMSKSKILTPSNKWRKVTREQIADIDPQLTLLAAQTVAYIPWLIRLFIYLANEQKPYSGQFHLDRHDKLSESAFGKSSLMPE